ncbi:MAG: SsrA-binding protein SmpB [Christensenellaceae bacterium]|jgi:SsrA-binding protein|nr:SsrA-binding protein SmpB [Christensenellaceae bacterium]
MKIIATNKKAHFEYTILDTYEAGIALEGWEVKSARAGNVSLAESFVLVRIEKSSGAMSVILKNAHIAGYPYATITQQNERRDRALLLSSAEIQKIANAVQIKGQTAIITKIYLNNRGLIKAELAVAKGKHTYDKKETIKQRDIERETARTLKNLNK